MSRRDSPRRLYYKTHVSADAQTRLITDCHATTGARHEDLLLLERIRYQRDALGLPIGKVIADRGYGNGQSYAELQARGIRHYIPLHDANTAQAHAQ